MKTIILGIGNPILQDDGVGIHVINTLRDQINDPTITIDTAYTGGMNLLDRIRGYDRAILIDAVKQKHGKIGDVKRYVLPDIPTVHSANPHDVSLAEAIQLSQSIGETNIPKTIIVIGIVIKNNLDFGEHLSPEVACAIPTALHMVLSEIKNT